MCRCICAGSRGARWPLIVLAAFSLLSPRGAVAATPSESEDLVVVDICSDDTGEATTAFLRGTQQVFAESKVRLRFRCAGPPPTSERSTSASFIEDEGGIALQLVTSADERSVRIIPWLENLHRPLAKTLALGRGTTLGLILQALTADLRAVPLRPLPAPRPGHDTSVSRPRSAVVEPPIMARAAEPSAWSGRTSSEPLQPVPVPSGNRSLSQGETPLAVAPQPASLTDHRSGASAQGPVVATPKGDAASGGVRERAGDSGLASSTSSSPSPVADRKGRTTSPTAGTALEAALPLAGIAWMPPNTIAPEIEVGLGWGGPRWWVTLDGVLQLDSSFVIEGRTFHTAGYGIRFGIRRTLLRSERFRWDAELAAVGHLSQYQRDDVPGSTMHQWFDAGAAVHSRAYVRLARHTAALLSLGAEACPTARRASIPGGPSRRVNLATLDMVAGLGFDF